MPAVARARAAKTKVVNGRVVSSRNRSGDPACSAAMSEWVSTRKSGTTPASVFAILGQCRAKARALKQAAMHKEAGNDAKAQRLEAIASGKKGPVTAKDRMALAKEKRANRVVDHLDKGGRVSFQKGDKTPAEATINQEATRFGLRQVQYHKPGSNRSVANSGIRRKWELVDWAKASNAKVMGRAANPITAATQGVAQPSPAKAPKPRGTYEERRDRLATRLFNKANEPQKSGSTFDEWGEGIAKRSRAMDRLNKIMGQRPNAPAAPSQAGPAPAKQTPSTKPAPASITPGWVEHELPNGHRVRSRDDGNLKSWAKDGREMTRLVPVGQTGKAYEHRTKRAWNKTYHSVDGGTTWHGSHAEAVKADPTVSKWTSGSKGGQPAPAQPSLREQAAAHRAKKIDAAGQALGKQAGDGTARDRAQALAARAQKLGQKARSASLRADKAGKSDVAAKKDAAYRTNFARSENLAIKAGMKQPKNVLDVTDSVRVVSASPMPSNPSLRAQADAHRAARNADRKVTLEKIGANGPRGSATAYVAEIQGKDPRYGLKREFQKGIKDYSGANSNRSRGVMETYSLTRGKVYEVNEPTSWKNADRYHVVVRGGGTKKVSADRAAEISERMAKFRARQSQPSPAPAQPSLRAQADAHRASKGTPAERARKFRSKSEMRREAIATAEKFVSTYQKSDTASAYKKVGIVKNLLDMEPPRVAKYFARRIRQVDPEAYKAVAASRYYEHSGVGRKFAFKNG